MKFIAALILLMCASAAQADVHFSIEIGHDSARYHYYDDRYYDRHRGYYDSYRYDRYHERREARRIERHYRRYSRYHHHYDRHDRRYYRCYRRHAW